MYKEPPLTAVDLGSNSIRLLCARCLSRPEHSLKIVFRALRVPRLGESFEPDRHLKPQAMERVFAATGELRDQVRKLGVQDIHVVATGVAREAVNQAEFIEGMRERLGMAVRIVDGEEESALTLLGVSSTLDGLTYPLLVCDIGGGSTEYALRLEDGTDAFRSIPLGAIRLTEQCGIKAPMREEDEKAVEGCIALHLEHIVLPSLRIAMLVAPAGTPTTLASIDQALTEYDPLRVHGYRLHYRRIKGIYDHLKSLTLDERRRIPGLDAGREDIIVAGAAILLKVMERFGISSLTVSEGGLLEGVLARTYRKQMGVIPHIYL